MRAQRDLFPDRLTATLHVVAAGCLVASFAAISSLMVTGSQSTVAPAAVFGPGALAVLIEGQVVDRVAKDRAARGDAPKWVESARAQRELLTVSAAAEALRIARGVKPPDAL